MNLTGYINKLREKRRDSPDRNPNSLSPNVRKMSVMEDHAIEMATRRLTLKLIKFASNPSEKDKFDQM